MKNYETQLLSITPDELSPPKAHIPYSELISLESIQTTNAYKRELSQLTKKLPYEIYRWPSFGQYTEDWYRVEVSEFKKQLQYCERGSCQVRADCNNLIDLSYLILNIISPGFTSCASKISDKLDSIKDQRLLIWLSMSSKVFYMYQVNNYFGLRMLNTNITWMCQELVRMKLFNNTSAAFKSERHIVHGLMLSGLPKSTASSLFHELKST